MTSDIQLIDADNYQMLVDDGYYEEKEIMPEATATPTPTVTSEATVTEEPDIDENTPEAIAEAVQNIDFSEEYDSRAVIQQLDQEFVKKVENILLGI